MEFVIANMDHLANIAYVLLYSLLAGNSLGEMA